MTTTIIDLALHLVDFVVSSPAPKCSVSGQNFSGASGVIGFLRDGRGRALVSRDHSPALSFSESHNLRLHGGFSSLPHKRCHPLQIRLYSLICKPCFCSHEWIFRQNNKKRSK